METLEIRRGRLIDHVQLVTENLAAQRRFYDAVLSALQISIGGEGPEYFYFDELFVSTADSPAAQGRTTGPTHLAFQAQSPEAVVQFHAAGLAAGGTDNGAPGKRPYHPGYFAAFLLDPDGNNIEAVFHGPAHRSADAIVIRWDP